MVIWSLCSENWISKISEKHPCLTYFSSASDCNLRNVNIEFDSNFRCYSYFHTLKPLNLIFVQGIRPVLSAFIFILER